MHPLKIVAPLVLALTIAGCQSSPDQPPKATSATPERCDAAAVRQLTGLKATPELLDEARVQSGATTARIIRPADVVTLEYLGDRLTLYTDEALIIQRITCG